MDVANASSHHERSTLMREFLAEGAVDLAEIDRILAETTPLAEAHGPTSEAGLRGVFNPPDPSNPRWVALIYLAARGHGADPRYAAVLEAEAPAVHSLPYAMVEGVREHPPEDREVLARFLDRAMRAEYLPPLKPASDGHDPWRDSALAARQATVRELLRAYAQHPDAIRDGGETLWALATGPSPEPWGSPIDAAMRSEALKVLAMGMTPADYRAALAERAGPVEAMDMEMVRAITFWPSAIVEAAVATPQPAWLDGWIGEDGYLSAEDFVPFREAYWRAHANSLTNPVPGEEFKDMSLYYLAYYVHNPLFSLEDRGLLLAEAEERLGPLVANLDKRVSEQDLTTMDVVLREAREAHDAELRGEPNSRLGVWLPPVLRERELAK
jgi:hypothetical protein